MVSSVDWVNSQTLSLTRNRIHIAQLFVSHFTG